MATQIKVRLSGDGARFADDSFDKVIGQEVPLRMYGLPKGTGTLRAFRLIEDGYAVELTVEMPDELKEELGLESYMHSAKVPFGERFSIGGPGNDAS